jgi:hypothetical protein
MTIWDLKGKHEAKTILELETVLQERYEPGVNSFWLSHDDEKHPTTALLVKGDLSTLLYVPREGHPGFTPVGGVKGLDEKEFTIFSIDTVEQELEVLNSQVVPLSTALSAARDFFASKELPKSYEWQEL